MAWSRMVSMERSDEEKLDTLATCAPALKDQPDYPWGLRITLTKNELKKLGLEGNAPNIGDTIDLRCLARVTSCSQDEVDGAPQCRVELQITDMALEDENTEETPSPRKRARPPYQLR